MTRLPKLRLAAFSVAVLFLTALTGYLLVWFAAWPIQYCIVGLPSYQTARTVADSMMAKSGPWIYVRGSFVLGFDGTVIGDPTWVFRYRNSATGQESVRIFVRTADYKPCHTRYGIDELPTHGTLPD